MSAFDAETLALWQSTPEIEIETSRGGGAPVHRTTIWIVTDGPSAYVRSVRGPQGRWYRELSANPHGAVHAGALRVAVDAEAVTDAAAIARVSELLRQKYEARWSGPTASMLRDETLPTTMRLLAA
ncbi:MAG: nitroreductase family deazaflavin-dependent oxidoreductase [Chloroflexi bacterium]|nr:nitroreductase family deazaflavin-dependent oxidoreductase [Chloroflexota bacterium]